jgi:eukaryotic-like serine/threonine-protein kinase
VNERYVAMEPTPRAHASAGQPSPSEDCTLGESDDDPWLRAVAAAPGLDMPRADLVAGTVVANTYEIVRPIGAGAMGVVYEAIDRALGRRVALKLHARRGDSRPQRVWREARAMARLADPHVVTVHEVGLHDDRLFIAMELVHGSDARRWVTRTSRRWPEVLAMYRQAARGLAAAHAVGIAHRDFKPDNVLVGDDGRVRVADFGLARELDASDATDAPTEGDEAHDREPVTRTGAAMGTPAYMAPELFAGQPADARSDQYAFCVALYEALHGERPPRSGPRGTGERARAERRGVPRFVDEALRRGLSPAAKDRFADMGALLRALEPRTRSKRLGLVAGIVTLGGVTAYAATRTRPCEGTEAAAGALWDAERDARVRSAFERSGFPDALTVADVVGPAITQWSTEAGLARREACEATRVRGEQTEARMELRLDCIERMHRRVGLLAASFEHADAVAVERAGDAITGLPELERCDDTEALAQAEPIAAVDRGEHTALRERIDGLDVELELGHVAAVAGEIDGVVAAAQAAGYADNLAAAELLRGRAALGRIETDLAAEALAAAVTASWRARDLATTAEAMRLLARALSTSPTQLDDALRWLDTAVALAESTPGSPDRMAAFELTRADAYYFASRNVEAEASARATLEQLEPGSPLEAAARTLLGKALMFQHRYDESIAEHRRAVMLAEHRRGPRHPEVANRLAGLALALEEDGHYDEAGELAGRALALREAVYGSDSAMAATSLVQVGDNLQLRNDIAGALAIYERALAITAALDPPDDALRIQVVQNAVQVLSNAGKLERARSLLRDTLPLATRAFGADSLRVGELLQTLSTLERSMDEVGNGVGHGRDALRLLERHLGPDHQRVGEAAISLAGALAEARRYDDALAMLARAERILEASAQPPPRVRGFIAALRADTLARAGREPEALAVSAVALAHFEAAYPAGNVELGKMLFFRAVRLVRAERPREARPLLERALGMLSEPGIDPALREGTAQELARLPAR